MSPKPSRKPAPRGKATGKEAGDPSLPFEEALTELERIVEELEDGSLSLDKSLSRFERGIQLSRQLQKQLTAAEARVRKLVAEEGGEPLLEDLGEVDEETEEGQEEDDEGLEDKGNPTLPF